MRVMVPGSQVRISQYGFHEGWSDIKSRTDTGNVVKGQMLKFFYLHIVCQAKESHPLYTVLENTCHISKTPRACYNGH